MRSPAEIVGALIVDLEHFRARPGLFVGQYNVTPEAVQAFLSGVMTGLDACGIAPSEKTCSEIFVAQGLILESPLNPLS